MSLGIVARYPVTRTPSRSGERAETARPQERTSPMRNIVAKNSHCCTSALHLSHGTSALQLDLSVARPQHLKSEFLSIRATSDPRSPHTSMSTESNSSNIHDAFVVLCGRVLGLTPDHGRFRPHVESYGRVGVTWNSSVQGMVSLLVRSRYVTRFGQPPDWIGNCHPHLEHLLLLASLHWDRPLPANRPNPITAPPGGERNYDILGPPKDLSVRWPSTATESEVLPQLASTPSFAELLRKEFGVDRAENMLIMLCDAKYRGNDGAELRDFVADGMLNLSLAVWRAENPSLGIDGEEIAWPIEVQEYHGLFQVWSPEHDTVGPFLSFEDAQGFVFGNWTDVCNGRLVPKTHGDG